MAMPEILDFVLCFTLEKPNVVASAERKSLLSLAHWKELVSITGPGTIH
jgi:hypothetical protein